MVAFIFTGLFPAVGVVVIMQDAIVGEKKEGTAAWVLSKPLTRPAFVISKLISNSIGVALTMVVVPTSLVFAIIFLVLKPVFSPLGLLATMGVIFVNLFFFLSLTLMLGTFFSGRGPVIGISLLILFLQQNLINVLPVLRFILPWNLIAPVGNQNPLVLSLATGAPIQSEHLIILAIVGIESILFTLIGLWRFSREEF